MCEFRYQWCSTCKDNFPMRENKYEELEECGNTFYCPEGHPLKISRESVVREMRREKRMSINKSKRCERLQKRIEGLRGVKTRYLNRLLRGECPYCGLIFDRTMSESGLVDGDLFKHIREKHAPKNGKNT